MHAVVVSVTIDDFEESGRDLREHLVPAIKQWPGFATGYWVAFDGHRTGRAVTVWESAEAARQAARTMEEGAATDPGVTFESIEVGEVVAHA